MSTPDESSVKLVPWATTQEEIFKLLRTPANLDHDITLTHAPQLLQSLHSGAEIASIVHFSTAASEVFTAGAKNRQLYVWTLNSSNKAYPDLDPHQKLKAVGEITCMIYIPSCRTYIGYCTDKTLRVFMDPVTGCEDIAYLTINHQITCLLYNKDDNEVIAGGKGFVETYGIQGKEFKTRLQKAKQIKGAVMKDEEVCDLKLDTQHKQIIILTDKGIYVVNYQTGSRTHLLVNRHTGSLTCLCLYHEGEFLITGSSEGDLKIWNSVVYTQVHEFPGHIEKVTAICCLPRDPIVFSSSSDGVIFVWRMDTFQKFMKLDVGAKVCSLKLLRDGTLVAQTPMDIYTYTLKQFYSTFTTCNANVVKLKRLRALGHQPNKILASNEDGRVQLYNPVTGTMVSAMLPLPKTQVLEQFAFNGKDGKMYTVLRGGDVLVLDTTRNPFRAVELLSAPDPQFAVACLSMMAVSIGAGQPTGSTDDSIIFMGTAGGMICVLESQCVLMETPVNAHTGGIVCLDCSTDVDQVNFKLKSTSRYLISAGVDNLVKLWGLEFEPDHSAWLLRLVLLQNIDCMGSPSHVAMFENVICVGFGDYGLVKMFRLAGLSKTEHRSELQGLYVLLTHISQFDHSDTVTALDMCPMINLFVTSGSDGFVKVWDTNNQLVKEMCFGQPVNTVCFASNRGDLLIGFQNRILLVPITKYMPQHYLEQMSNRMFTDDEKEPAIDITSKRKKVWFDPKMIPKYSTDLVARMSQKVKLKTGTTDDDADLLTLERMRSDLSSESGIGTSIFGGDSRRPSLTRENTSLSLNDALSREVSNASLDDDAPTRGNSGDTKSGRASSRRRGRGPAKRLKRDLEDKDLRKISIGETLEELDEEDISAPSAKDLRLAREDSLLYFRKPVSWLEGKELTPSLLRDLENTARMTRSAELLLPDYLQSSTDEVIPITPEPKKGPEYTEEQLRALTPWERFLLTKKPIIAPDGYIPNSVVRRQIGFVKPQSPIPPWQLKPVPDADPRHMPEGWKPKKEKSGSSFDGSKSANEDVDLENIMSMKRASTIQNVKVQQSIKEASLFIGTAMCLLPDGTEPEGVPNFSWKSVKEDIADLTPLVRPDSGELTPSKESTTVTPLPVKVTPEDKTQSSTKFEPKSLTKPLRKVDIDIGSGLALDNLGPRGPPRVGKMPPPLDMEKGKSFRLSQAVSKTPMEVPHEESENVTEDGGSVVSGVSTEVSTATGNSREKKTKKADNRKPGAKKNNQGKADSDAPRTVGVKKAIAAPVKKLTKEEELSLLQRIVKEEWFPEGIPPILDLVNGELTKLVDTADSKVFNCVCDYLVQIFQELSIGPKHLPRIGDKLNKQLSNPSAIIRKKAIWTLKQLGLSVKKETVASFLPSLLDAKDDAKEEMINTLTELLGASSNRDGLSNLMASLGIRKPIGTKEEQQAALKAISEKLQSDAEKLKSESSDVKKQRMEMFVSAFNLPQDVNVLRSGGSNNRALDSMLSYLDKENSWDRQSTNSTDSRQRSRRGREKSKTKRKGRQSKDKHGKNEADNDETMSVDTSVQTDPQSDDEGRRRRGRWRRGGMSEFRPGGDGEDFDDDEEDYEDDETVQNEESAGQRQEDGMFKEDSGLFTRIDFDFTPNMFRSETGGSEWSDDVPPLVNTTTPGRPKGASVHKFYERRDHVATVTTQDPQRIYTGSTGFPTMPSIEEPSGRTQDSMNFMEKDSDLHSLSNYTDTSKNVTSKTHDGVSVGDSGIDRDFMSEVSSQAFGGSESLYDQGRPKLSPIKSQTNLKGEDIPSKKEPDWKEFLESNRPQEKKKTVDFACKEVTETQYERIPMLPPIMYVDPEKPTLPGEAGLRLLHSIRLADKERTTDAAGRCVAALPGRLTITTHNQPDGDTNYGLLRMHWTTQIPIIFSERTYSEGQFDRQTNDVHNEVNTHRSEPPTEKPTFPRLIRADTNIGKSNVKMAVTKAKNLPIFSCSEKKDYQWSMPMAPAPKRKSLMDSGSQFYNTHSQQFKWATKKMDHNVSCTKSVQLPKMENRASTFVATSLNDDVMSVISHSSLALMPSLAMEKVFKNINSSSYS